MLPKPCYKYPPSIGLGLPLRRRRTRGEPDSHQGNETAATPMARSPTDSDLDPENPNAQIAGRQANMEHPDPDEENSNAEMIPGTQADIEHPVNNNVPETPSTVAAIGLEQMVLASSRRQPFASATKNFTGHNNNADELDAPTSPSPANRSALPDITSADRISATGPGAETLSMRRPITNIQELNIQELMNRNRAERFTRNDRIKRERPNRYGEGHFELTPIRYMRAGIPLVPPLELRVPPPRTPASLMPPPQTPVSQIKRADSPASRLLRPTGPSPALIVRSTSTHDEGNATPGVVRKLFPQHGTNLVSTPVPNRNASEPQLVRPRTGHDPLRQSRLRSVSFASALDEDMEMASPSVAIAECPTGETHVTTPQSQTGETTVITPEGQIGGSPPMPHTPRTPNTWISPSQITPDLVARMLTTPVYRNRDEPMEMTPSPPELKPDSPGDKKMEDVFWTPKKAGASLNKRVASAQHPTPMESKAPIANSAPFGDAMAQDSAPIQNVAPIGNSAPVQDAMSPGTTRVRTVISTEITTTITKTPSPPQSPIPTRRPTDSRRRVAATPHRAANAPRREVASNPQRKGKGGAEQNTNRRRTAEHVIPGGINRRQELRTSPRYSLRDSTRGIMPGTYTLTPVRNRPFEAESATKKK